MIGTRILTALAATSLLALPSAAFAIRQYILPSSTMVDGKEAWVTVDAGMSDTLFASERPLPLADIKVWAPDGSAVTQDNPVSGKQRNSFELHLTQPGTYKIASTSDGIFGGYVQNGEMKRLPRDMKPDQVAAAIPADATDIRVNQISSRVESFVTLGAPSEGAFKPTGQGLELEPLGHMSEFVTDEPARFRLLVDGKPAAGIAVTLIAGGTRYRDALGDVSFTADKDGVVAVKWPAPGLYCLNASTKAASTVKGLTERRMTYAATIEVLTP